MPRPRRASQSKDVIAITHPDDARRNIPTAELEPVMADADRQPIRVAYERRNRDLDPQLVWRGKDEQDDRDLIVAAPPLFTQEKVHPKVLVDDLMRLSRRGQQDDATQLDLFADFNGLHDPDARAEFYRHDQSWTNRMILGDSLQVMASLAEREELRGKVQCVYLDPPYGIKFNSNFQWSTTSRDVRDGNIAHVTREPEQVKAFRDTWRDGIHSYLSYLRDRLTVARDLLADSGSVFVQIGDENVHRVRAVMDEVFGDQNYVSILSLQKTAARSSLFLQNVNDYVIWYAKDADQTKFRRIFVDRPIDEHLIGQYPLIYRNDGLSNGIRNSQGTPGVSEMARAVILTSSHEYSRGKDHIAFQGKTFGPGSRYWSTSPEGIYRLGKAGRIVPGGSSLSYLRRLSDFPYLELNNTWADVSTGGGADRSYVVQTVPRVIQRCILMTTDPGDLVLDPTCGSGTTAYVAEQWGRRWITIDTSRVALALARARVMGARYPYYLLSDSPEGQRKEAEISRRELSEAPTYGSLRQGFVCQRVPHITLRAIANNAEIDVIWETAQQELEPLREELNSALGQSWEEWEIPREAEDGWPAAAMEAHRRWWERRIARQQEIDASIAARADFEYLYDKPYEDRTKVRVAGPFTVESVSPHRVIAADDDGGRTADTGDSHRYDGDLPERDFAGMILDNLRTSGVQQSQKADKIDFSALTGWPGEYICAEGRFMEGETERRAGIFIGPEFGTVQRADLAKAAREAAEAGFHAVIACAFSYDAHASELGSIGSLPVLKARMNSDLHMAEDLRNDSRGNLFVIFGEPDIELLEAAPGPSGEEMIQVKINGVDIFDPATGQVRSDDTGGIACWFVDTNYNEESFFVRQAYFPRCQQRPLQGPENHAESGDRRGSLGHAEPRRIPPLPQTGVGPHRRQGDQPPRRRGDEGAEGLTPSLGEPATTQRPTPPSSPTAAAWNGPGAGP